MKNEFTSKADRLFLTRYNSISEKLLMKYRNSLDNTLRIDITLAKIEKELSVLLSELYTDSTIGDISNQYKYSLILQFENCILVIPRNPVEHFFNGPWKKILTDCKDHMKRSEFSYSYDRGFIKAGKTKIIEVLSHATAYSLFISDYLPSKGIVSLQPVEPKAKDKGMKGVSNDENATLREKAIDLLYRELRRFWPLANPEEFRSCFRFEFNTGEKLGFHGKQNTLVYFSDQLMMIGLLPCSSDDFIERNWITDPPTKLLKNQISVVRSRNGKFKPPLSQVIDASIKKVRLFLNGENH